MLANSLYSNFVDAADDNGSIKNNTTNLDYIKTLAAGIIRYDLYNELYASGKGALYPAVGLTAFTNKFNLMNPVDSDLAKRLTFGTAISHTSLGISASGAVANPTQNYAKTYIIPETDILSSSMHMVFYSTTENNTQNSIEIGSQNPSTGASCYLQISRNTAARYMETNFNSLNTAATALLRSGNGTIFSSKGFFCGNRLGTTTSIFSFNNNINQSGVIGNVTGTMTSDFRLFNWTDNTQNSGLPSNRSCGLASIGLGLTARKIELYSHLVYTAQGIKNRQ